MAAQPLSRIVLAAVLATLPSGPQAASAQLASGFSMTTGIPDEPPESADECAPLHPGTEDEVRLTPTGVLTLEFHSVCLHRWAQGENLADVTLQVSAYLHASGNVERLLHVPSWTVSERSVGVHEGIGAGPIVTFMDDALQLTFGWALNARAARMYYGVGFSVVGLR